MACSLSGLGALNLGRFRDCRALCDLGFRARWVHEALGSADCCWVGLGSGLFTLGAGSWDLNIVWKGSSFVIMAQAFSDMRCLRGFLAFERIQHLWHVQLFRGGSTMNFWELATSCKPAPSYGHLTLESLSDRRQPKVESAVDRIEKTIGHQKRPVRCRRDNLPTEQAAVHRSRELIPRDAYP